MAKDTSKYSVKPANQGASFIAGLGRGLSEQLPKEVANYRLASGLQNFAKESAGRSQMENLAAISAVPGVTPQTVQAFTELAKNQNLRSSLRRGDEKNLEQTLAPREEISFANLDKNKSSRKLAQEEGIGQNVLPEEVGQGGILDERNAAREAVKTFVPPNPQEFESQLAKTWDKNPNLSWEQANQLTNEYYERQARMPEAERAEDKRLQVEQERLEGKFNKSLETKLQKQGRDVFNDVTGEMKNNLIRGMERDIVMNPKSNEDDIINTWTNKALNMAKDKDELNTLANQNAFKAFFDQDNTVTKLKNAQKTYAEAENLEEYYNWLRTSATEPTMNAKGEIIQPGRSGMGMSAAAAAQIAFPKSKGVKQVISSFKPQGDPIVDAKRLAMLIEPQITRNDSFLAIAKEMKDAYPNFSTSAFLRQLTDDRSGYGWGERLNRELTAGSFDTFPNWADTWFLPSFRELNR